MYFLKITVQFGEVTVKYLNMLYMTKCDVLNGQEVVGPGIKWATHHGKNVARLAQ